MDTRSPFDPRPVLVLLGVPLIGFGEAWAYYLARSVLLTHWINERGVDPPMAYEAYSHTASGPLFGMALGAVLGIVIGGWGTAALGMVVMAIGLALVPFADLGSTWSLALPMLAAAAGRGMVSVGLLSALIDGLRGSRRWLLLTGAASWLALVNLAALSAGSLGSSLQTSGQAPGGAVMVLVAVALVVDALLVAGVGLAWLLLGRRFVEPDSRRRQFHLAPHAAALGLIVLAAPALSLMYQGHQVLWQQYFNWTQATGVTPGLLELLNPALVAGTLGVLAMVGLALHLFRVRADRLPWVGAALAGLVVCVAVLVPQVAGWSTTVDPGVPLMLGFVLLGLAEGPLVVLPVVGWGRGLHWRLVPLLVGVWRGLQELMTWGLVGLGALDGDAWAAWVWPVVVVLGVLSILMGVIGALLTPLWRSRNDVDSSLAPTLEQP